MAWSCNSPDLDDDGVKEHRIELQHCIACSGVVMPPQSDAYTPTATVSTARKTCLVKAILTSLEGLDVSSQAEYGAGVASNSRRHSRVWLPDPPRRMRGRKIKAAIGSAHCTCQIALIASPAKAISDR